MASFPPGVDFAARYEAGTGRPLPRLPPWAAQRDPLFHQPARQRLRSAAIAAVWRSDVARVWEDVMHNLGRAYFIPAFQVFLSFQ